MKIITKQIKSDLETKGFFIIPSVIKEDNLLNNLSLTIDYSFEKHRKIQIKNGNDIITEGVALNCLQDGFNYMYLLGYLLDIGFIHDLEECFFESKCILNSFSALNNIPYQPNFSSIVYRDLRFYSGDFPIMLNCLLMVDDFTIENGGTYLLPGSHLIKDKPTDEEFFANAIQATGTKGSILVFNSNIWHASAPNITIEGRKAIPFTLSKPFMKPLFDYPRAIGYDKAEFFTEELSQLLGYNSRVPSSLDEWYQPADKRFYKKDQD